MSIRHPTGRRVCFIIEKIAGRSGGAERVLIEAANALAARGHMVEIISHEHRAVAPFYPTLPGVVLSNLRPLRANRPRARRGLDHLRNLIDRTLPPVFPLDHLLWLSRNGGFWRRLRRHLRATRPDVAVAFMPPAVTALALAEPGYPLRRIAAMHNEPAQDFLNPARWDPSPLDRRRRLALMGRMDAITVLLPEYRDWYPPHLRAKTHVLPNPVRDVDPARLAAATRGPTILAVGRLAAVKRPALLIDAFARVRADFPDWTLKLYGEGPLKPDLAAQIARLDLGAQVHLMGQTDAITDAYLAAALLAHPAEFEGFPLAVTEALASGLPVVGFDDCSGLNRLVQSGTNGVLVPADDPAGRTTAFAMALAALMRDDALRTRLGANGPATVAAYAPDHVTALWDALLFPPDPARTDA